MRRNTINRLLTFGAIIVLAHPSQIRCSLTHRAQRVGGMMHIIVADMDKLGKLYNDDAIVITKGMPQSGDGIQKFFSGSSQRLGRS